MKDAINHFSDPPYVTIKPGYRPGMPAPTDNQVKNKHLYSFKKYGDQRVPRKGQDMFDTTMRSTL